MITLWTFGDSFTSPFTNDGWYLKEYRKYKGYTPKFFAEIISEKLNIDYKNYGGEGDNETILNQLVDEIDKIKDGDIVLIGWTDMARFRVVDTKENHWTIIYPNRTKDAHHNDFSENSLKEILVNRTHELYIEQHKKLIKLIDKSLENCNVIHWDWCRLDILPFDTIYKETNAQIDDHHWSEKGHQQFAEWVLDVLNNNKKIDFWDKVN